MADYKLRLDVDAKLLEQALEKAVKKAFGKIPAMSGGGIGGGFGGMGGVIKHQKVEQKYQKVSQKLWKDDIAARKKNEHEMKMIYIREKAALRAHNIMLEKSGVQMARTFRNLGQLAGGRFGGTAGTVMDMGFQKLSSARRNRSNTKSAQGKWDAADNSNRAAVTPWMGERPELAGGFNKIMDQVDKFKETGTGKAMSANFNAFKKTKGGGAAVGIASKVPQMVKLAGIGAALAGGAGLGKMIVDSSPMLKAMLKLLNVGVMLILRPIGDFIGFMLRPLLLQFVTKVAIPAYKSGSKLAKEWGTKIGKVLLLMFTNPEQFLSLAVVNPLLQALAKMAAGLDRRLRVFMVQMNPLMTEDQKEVEQNKIATEQFAREFAGSDQAIQKKYPGLFNDPETGLAGGLLGGLADTETGKRLQELQEMTTEELNMGNAKTDKVIDNIKAAGDAVIELEDKVIIGNESQQQTADNTAELVRLAQEAAAVEIARTNDNNVKMDDIMEEQKTYFKENPYKGRDKFGQPIQGSQEIEEAAAAKQAAAVAASTTGIAIISVAGQKILDKYNDWKESNGGGPAVGVRGDKEFGKWNTQVDDNPLIDLGPRAVELREDAEMWSEAYAEAARLGSEVDDEYRVLKRSAAASAESMEEASCEVEKVLTFSIDAAENMALMGDAAKLMADNMLGAYDYIKSKFIRMGYRMVGGTGGGSGSSGTSPGGVSPSEALVNSEAKYKLTFGDGGPDVIKTLNTDGVAYYQKMYSAGTPYKDRGPMLSFTKMARGGIIGEKIFGIGESGQQYMFGESGPETVTPGVGGTVNNRGGGSTFNITINASNVGDIERQLKPAILKMLKESTSRAGIV